MSATRAFARKELSEVVHTWRLWVLPGVLLFTGLFSPVLAAMLPRLAKYATGQNPGTIIKLATPTSYDAYVQFLGNLQQIAALTVVIIDGGLITAEVRSGTAALGRRASARGRTAAPGPERRNARGARTRTRTPR